MRCLAYTLESKASHLAVLKLQEVGEDPPGVFPEGDAVCWEKRQTGNPHSCWVDDVITPTPHLSGGISTC